MTSDHIMDPNADDESPPLLGSAATIVPRRKNHKRDARILSFSFLFVFTAYGAAQNLESTVNTEGDLGTTSLGLLYLSFTVFLLVGAPMVRLLGSKRALVIGTSGYWLFIASNLKPSWFTMVPSSLYLGYTSSIIWVAQGTYLTCAARDHAKDFNLHEGTVIGSFNGEFYGIYASSGVIGNLVSLALLRGGKEGEGLSGTTLLFITFLGSATVGTLLMCLLSNRDHKSEGIVESFDDCTITPSLFESAVAPLLDKRILLMIPILSYTGLQAAFVWAKFTKEVVSPALGASGIGGAMAIFGLFDTMSSVIAGRFTSGPRSITVIITGGALVQISVLVWLVINKNFTSGTALLFPLLMAALWGVGNAIFNTQLSALFGMLFKHDTEAAFSQLKLWHSAFVAVVFFLSPYVAFQVMSAAMIVFLCISVACFLYLTLHVEKAFIHKA